MATSANPAPARVSQRERLFFLGMALLLVANSIMVFGYFKLAGISTFASPWWVHVHAISFMVWLPLYIGQSALARTGRMALHRRLGKLGAGLAAWMVLVGMVTVMLSIANGRGSPAFTPASFLAVDWTLSLLFGGMVTAAIVKVRQTDWHRRLMLGATLIVIGPGISRIFARGGIPGVPEFGLAPGLGSAVNVSLSMAVIIFVAMAFDRYNRGHVHPAYYWGLAALFAVPAIAQLLSLFPPFIALANTIAS